MKQVIEAQLAAAAACVDAARALLAGWVPPGEEPATAATEPGGICRHDSKIPAGTLARPMAWLCRDCGHEGGGDP